MKTVSSVLLLISLLMVITACGNKEAGRAEKPDTEPDAEEEEITVENEVERNTYKLSSTVEDVISDPCFEDFGYLLFPVDRSVSEDMTLEEISSSSVYVWYNYIDPDKTVEIIQDLHDRAAAEEQIIPYGAGRQAQGWRQLLETGMRFLISGERIFPRHPQ